MVTHTYDVVGFLEDQFLHSRTEDDFLFVTGAKNQGVGYIDTKMKDYFNVPTSLRDRRAARSNILHGVVPRWCDMVLWFDSLNIPDSMWTAISENNYLRLFSLIELITLSQGASATYLNDMMQKDPLYADIYQKDTLFLSTTRSDAKVTIDDTEADITVPTWVEFKVSILQEEDTFDLSFKIYVDTDAFCDNYDITTITKVVPPCDPTVFFRTYKFDGEMGAIIESAAFGGNLLNQAISEHDQQGLFVFYTKYVMDADRNYRVPFHILHKGPKSPTTLECRKAIKDYLLSTQLANETDINTHFPELFIDCVYYVIPLWDHATERPDRVLYPAYTPVLEKVYQHTYDYFKDARDVFLSKAQILRTSESDLFSLVYPHALNAEPLNLMDLYPTYMAHSTHSIEFEYMDPLDKEFARNLIRSFALLKGELTASDVIITIEDELRYVTFSAGRAEFHVMDMDSYFKSEE